VKLLLVLHVHPASVFKLQYEQQQMNLSGIRPASPPPLYTVAKT